MIFEKLSYENANKIKDFPKIYTLNNAGAKPIYEYYGSLGEAGVPDTLIMVSNEFSKEGMYVLEYIYVEESLRGCGFSEHLVDKICEELKGRSINHLYYSDSVKLYETESNLEFMSKLGFSLAEDISYTFKYKLSDIVLDSSYDDLFMTASQIEEIHSIDEYSDKRIATLIKERDVYFEKTDFMPNLSDFYIYKGSIQGALIGSLFEDWVLNFGTVYVDEFLKEQRLFAYMFLKAVSGLKEYGNKDYDIWINIKDFDVCREMIGMIASPYEMLAVGEYVREI